MISIDTDSSVIGPWVIDRLPNMSRLTFNGRMDAFTSLGYSQHGRMVMGVLFSDHSPVLKGINAHLAIDIPPGNNGSSLRFMFGHAMSYPFDQLKCVRITAHVPKRHHAMRKMIHTLGFVEEGNMKHGFLIDDCIVYGLTKRNAEKWMLHADKNKHILIPRGV